MLKIWDNWPRMQWYDNNKNCFHCHQLHLHDASKGVQQEFEYCCYHQHFLQIFLAFLEKFLTITVSKNVNGSSSSTVFLWSGQPVEPLSSFELPPQLDSAGELGSLGIAFYKCFIMKKVVSWSLRLFPYIKTHKLKVDECTKAAQHASLSYLSVIIFPAEKNADRRQEIFKTP